MSANSVELTAATIEAALAEPTVTFIRLPAAQLPGADRLSAALQAFRTHDVVAARDAKAWLCERALIDHATARTTLALGHDRVLGFYSLAAPHADLNEGERTAAGVSAECRRVPATLMAWIARDHEGPVTGRQLFVHTLGIARRASELAGQRRLVSDLRLRMNGQPRRCPCWPGDRRIELNPGWISYWLRTCTSAVASADRRRSGPRWPRPGRQSPRQSRWWLPVEGACRRSGMSARAR
jgi:hypothetical protein